jgi:hypothetical protein
MRAITLLSDAWFAEARALTVDLAPDRPHPGVGCRLQYDVLGAGGRRFLQVVEDGALRQWEPGELDRPDIEVRLDRDDARRIYRRELDGTGALSVTIVAERRADGDYVGPPSPMDLGEQLELADLPRLPEATLTVQYEYPAGPFGHVSFAIAFVDGRVDAMQLGRMPEPDATVEVPFRVMAQVRRGDLSILEALEHGRVDGKLGPLGLLAGISESPEFHRAELACGASGLALGNLGATFADPAHQAALDELAKLTA